MNTEMDHDLPLQLFWDLLQWGRVRMNTEMSVPYVDTYQMIPASMGPRSDEHGNLVDWIATNSGRQGFNGAAFG